MGVPSGAVYEKKPCATFSPAQQRKAKAAAEKEKQIQLITIPVQFVSIKLQVREGATVANAKCLWGVCGRPTHRSSIVGARILEVALLLHIDAVLCLIAILVGAVEVHLLLLPNDLDGLRGRSLGSRMHLAQQHCCNSQQLAEDKMSYHREAKDRRASHLQCIALAGL